MKKSLSVVTHNEGVARLATRKRALLMNSNPRCNTPRFQEWYRISVPIGTALHLRIATSYKCAVVSRRACIEG